jgi:hypothetical protein
MAVIEAKKPSEALAQRIDAIEESYEYMLAYAAQGRAGEQGAPEPGIRSFLKKLDAALDRLDSVALDAAQTDDANAFGTVVGVLAEDAAKTRALVRFVLARGDIGSQLIDNLNASIHLRALLTDLFVIDEWLKGSAA